MGLGLALIICAVYVAKIDWNKARDESLERVGRKIGENSFGESLLDEGEDWKSASEFSEKKKKIHFSDKNEYFYIEPLSGAHSPELDFASAPPKKHNKFMEANGEELEDLLLKQETLTEGSRIEPTTIPQETRNGKMSVNES